MKNITLLFCLIALITACTEGMDYQTYKKNKLEYQLVKQKIIAQDANLQIMIGKLSPSESAAIEEQIKLIKENSFFAFIEITKTNDKELSALFNAIDNVMNKLVYLTIILIL
jgi:hypothetical protein